MSVRDPDRTRAAIFDAALAEFAALGPAGARVDAIAAAARVNKRMLYHYFGSKEGLYAALREAQTERLSASLFSAGEAIGEQLAQSQRRLIDEGDWTRLAVWEALDEPSSRAPASDDWAVSVAALRTAQGSGEVAADLDAAQLLLSMVALVMFPLAFPQLTTAITGLAPSDPLFALRRAEFLKAFGSRLTGAPLAKPRYRLNATTRRPERLAE